MTSRERVIAAIHRKPVDRVPVDYTATATMTKRLIHDLDTGDEKTLLKKLGVDIGRVGPALHPGALGEYYGHVFVRRLGEGRYVDSWGITWQKADTHGNDEFYDVVDFPLKNAASVAEVENHPWPLPEQDWDFSVVPSQIDALSGLAISSGTSSVFDDAWRMRGMENFLADLAGDPDIARAILRKTCDYWLDYGRRVLEAGKGRIDLMWTSDDLGTQNGLLISREMCRKFVMPLIRERVELFKSHNALACMHSCGGIFDIIGDIADTGVQLLNPIQPLAAGMDRERIQTLYGNVLSFHGSVDQQKALVFGTPTDVRAEVKACLNTLGRKGGYILSACHALGTDIPTANVVALYEAAKPGSLN